MGKGQIQKGRYRRAKKSMAMLTASYPKNVVAYSA
jgi:hypothetical protein